MMALDLCNRFGDSGMTAEELLANVEIKSTRPDDVSRIIEFIARSWGMSGNFEAFTQVVHSKMDLMKSVKLIDKRDGEIYGLLLFAYYPIQEGSPIMGINPSLGRYLNQYTQLNGHSFIIDERLRGHGLDKKMLLFGKEYIDTFDFVWCAVEKDLKSHNYWKKLGFKKIFSIPEASFYIISNNDAINFDLSHYYGLKEFS